MNALRLRVVVAEDELHARRNLREYLDAVDEVELVGEAADGLEALRVIEETRPDLLLLDVRLPEISGIEVARRMTHEAAIIFTTAYDRFAIAAFELGALDYLLKPFGRDRFVAAIDRARRNHSAGVPGAAARAADSTAEPLQRLFARSGERIVPIAASSIRHISAAGDYAELHTEGGTHLVHVSLSELAGRLDPRKFVRVHRSHVVNLDCVAHMRPWDDRRLLVVMTDGAEVVASRSASERIRRDVR